MYSHQVPQVILKQRILAVLSQHSVFSRLHEEQREDVASNCQIRTLLPGQESEEERNYSYRFLHSRSANWKLTFQLHTKSRAHGSCN